MKKLLSILGTITLIGTASTSVVACGGGQELTPEPSPKQKTDLKTEITTLRLNVLFDVNKINQNLDSVVLKDVHITLWLKPKLINPTIKYFSDGQGKTDVSNQNQKAGDLYVVITADINDANYQGATNPIKIFLKQYKLSDIDQLTGLNLIANSSKKFEDFNSIILNNNVFKNKSISFIFTTVIYYEENPVSEINSDNSQRSGTFLVVIKASFKEQNWYGETSKIKITVK